MAVFIFRNTLEVIILLYMFRALLRSSSGGQLYYCSIRFRHCLQVTVQYTVYKRTSLESACLSFHTPTAVIKNHHFKQLIVCTTICPPYFHLTSRINLKYNIKVNFKSVLWLSSFSEIRWRDFFLCAEGDIETNATLQTEKGDLQFHYTQETRRFNSKTHQSSCYYKEPKKEPRSPRIYVSQQLQK